MKKYLLTIASLLAMLSLTGVAQLGAAAAKPGVTPHVSAHARPALSEATIRAEIHTGKLKRVTGKQAAELTAKAKIAKILARTRTVGGTYIGRYQEQGRLWYDETYSVGQYGYYYYIYYYKNWLVCSRGYPSSGYCLDANSYDYYENIYYNGSWYYGAPNGPYSG